jgi:hypothetical protein
VQHNNPAIIHGNGGPSSMINTLPGISATCWTNLTSELGTALDVAICKNAILPYIPPNRAPIAAAWCCCGFYTRVFSQSQKADKLIIICNNMPGIQGNPSHVHDASLVHSFWLSHRGIRTTVQVISLGESGPHCLFSHILVPAYLDQRLWDAVVHIFLRHVT